MNQHAELYDALVDIGRLLDVGGDSELAPPRHRAVT